MLKQTQLKDVPIGTTFEVWKRKFTVLESNDEGVFVLAAEIETEMPFRSKSDSYDVAVNDFRDSTVRNWLNDEYLGLLQKDGLENGDILDTVVDLKCTLGQHEYGTDTVKAGLLTLEQYGEYYDIIPKTDGWWWLATPWKTPNRSPCTGVTALAWLVHSSGDCGLSFCSSSVGVRPALTLNPSLLVTWEDGKEVAADEAKSLHWDGYIKYLHRWAVEHSDKEFTGCSPVCYDEWQGCEGADEDEDE